MASLETKQKILNAALKQFNQHGLVNVRLQHIADEAFVSIGNMTYHYRTKELIVEAIWNQLKKKQETLLMEFRVVPLFEDIERQMRSTFALQQAYLFFYLDTLEIMRAFPDIRDEHRLHNAWQVQQLEMMIYFNISRGVFKSEIPPLQYEELAKQYWMTSDMWLSRQKILGNEIYDIQSHRNALWALLIPICTERGIQELQQLNAMIAENLI